MTFNNNNYVINPQHMHDETYYDNRFSILHIMSITMSCNAMIDNTCIQNYCTISILVVTVLNIMH